MMTERSRARWVRVASSRRPSPKLDAAPSACSPSVDERRPINRDVKPFPFLRSHAAQRRACFDPRGMHSRAGGGRGVLSQPRSARAVGGKRKPSDGSLSNAGWTDGVRWGRV